MKQTLFQEKYPVFVAEISKTETDLQTMGDVIAYFRSKISENAEVQFIAEFDHYAHTKAIGGEVAADITAAVNLVFCFGRVLANPQVLAVRPRSLGIVERGDEFVVTFMEAPMLPANEAMEAWVRGMRRDI